MPNYSSVGQMVKPPIPDEHTHADSHLYYIDSLSYCVIAMQSTSSFVSKTSVVFVLGRRRVETKQTRKFPAEFLSPGKKLILKNRFRVKTNAAKNYPA